jgi:ubiquitin C-terminal hydrolase
MRQVPYALRGVLVHDGSAQSGHYWALVRQPDGSWRKCNDVTVADVRRSSLRVWLRVLTFFRYLWTT